MTDATTMIAGAQPYMPAEDREAILQGIGEILRSGEFTQGRHVRAFEAAAAEMAGTRHAFAVSSGGTALEVMFEAIDVAGGEVIVPTETFVATANAVVRAGGTPVFVDVDRSTLSLRVGDVAEALTPRTRAVVLVHMFGLMSPEIPTIRALCAERGVHLLEDAAHAHGATLQGKRAGSLGAAASFSYYATKVLTTGEGGIITTDDHAVAERIKSLRDHGRARDGVTFDLAGNNFRLPEIPALIGVYQQRRLQEVLAHRRQIASIYRRQLQGHESVELIDPEPREGHSYWRYPLLLPRHVDRAGLQEAMAKRYRARVTWMYEPLVHQQPYYRARLPGLSLPNAEDVCGRLINLPTHSGVSEQAADRIAMGLRELLR